MEQENGNEYAQTQELKQDSFGETKLYSAGYSYKYEGESACRYETLAVTSKQVVRYTCYFYEGENETPMAVMNDAIKSYRTDAAYYETHPLVMENAAQLPSMQPADGGTHPTQSPAPSAATTNFKVEAAQPIISGTAKYDGGFFSVDLPAGWQIQTMGQYNTFGFRAWNPNDPDYEIFYYGSLNPFNKSDAAKAWNKSNAGYGFPYDIYGDAPVVSQDNAAELFCVWNEFASTVAKYTGTAYQAGFSFPKLTNFAVIESLPVNTYFANIATDEALVRGSFQSSRGTNCLAKCCATIYSVGTYNYGGVDMLPLCALSVSGVLAPQDGFVEVEQILSDCIYSLNFTDAYVSEAEDYIKKTAEGYMAANAALQATYDSYNAAWSARQTLYDIISQKNSDATLGYDRLYDPDTGEVYRAELGFYDSYDVNRDQYSNPNLRIVDGNTENYYLDGVDYYIYK